MAISSRSPSEGRPAGVLKLGTLERADLAIAAVLFVAGVLLYLPFRSASLDDFDSFNFARAIVSFSPADFRPHPPGYALYVGLGRMALALAGEPRVALTSLSAVCGGLSLALLFALGRVISGRLAGLSAALLLAGTPLMWLNSEKALSDVPGLAALLGSALLLALATRGGRLPPWVAAAAIGAAAGFRPQAMLGLGSAFLVAAVTCRWHVRQLATSGLALIAGVLVWLLPVLAALGWSLDRLRGYMTGAAGFVASQESLFATAVTPAALLARWQAVWGWSSSALAGPWPEAVRVVLLVALAGLAWHGARRNPGAARLCLAWLLPQALLHLLFLNPELTRYGLALWPPVLLLAGIGLAELSGRPFGRAVRLPAGWGAGLALVFFGVTAAAGLPLAGQLSSVPAPPDRLAAYLESRLPSGSTLITAGQSYNALGYGLPGWDVRLTDHFGEAGLAQAMAAGTWDYVVVADPEALRPDERYVELETVTFTRDPQIHAKHARVVASIYGRADALSGRDFALPPDGTIRIGTPADGRYVLGGWYRREEIGGLPARWTGDGDEAQLRLLLPAVGTTVRLRAFSFAGEQDVALSCNGQPVATVRIGPAWTQAEAQLPATCSRGDTQPALLALRPALRRAPAEGGASTDRRTLGIAVTEIAVER